MLKSQVFKSVLTLLGLLLISVIVEWAFPRARETNKIPPQSNQSSSEEQHSASSRNRPLIEVQKHIEDGSSHSRTKRTSDSFVQQAPAKNIPGEARETLKLIEQGGPFPYDRDGIVFQNREEHLPKRKRGYYLEYTVRTPGNRDRGARRIIAGLNGERYYTDDHYNSFRRID